MKNVVLSVMILAGSVFSVRAQAVEVPGWDRPQAEATMKVTQAKGTLSQIDSVDLQLNQRSVEAKINKTHKLVFHIVEVTEAGCGSKKVLARVSQPSVGSGPTVAGGVVKHFVLQLIDHRTRVCEDYRPYMWEAKITQIRKSAVFQAGVPVGSVVLEGDPQPIYTIQKH